MMKCYTKYNDSGEILGYVWISEQQQKPHVQCIEGEYDANKYTIDKENKKAVLKNKPKPKTKKVVKEENNGTTSD